MTDFLAFLFPYDYAVRVALVTAIAAYGCFITLRTGVFAVPQAGIMAIGAYTSAILSAKFGVAIPLAETAGIAAGAATGLVLAIALGRLDGIRLAIATIAFSEIVRVVLLNIPITGGGVGLTGIPRVTTDWQLVGAALICLVVFARFARTPAGDAMVALRMDPVVASHQGVSVFKYRVGVFVGAGLTSGTAGVLFAHLSGFLVPDNFGFGQLTTLLAAAIVGGMTASIGPIVGAAIVVGIPEVSGQFQAYRFVFNGIIIVVVIAFAPGGVAVVLQSALSWLVRYFKMRSSPERLPVAVPSAPASPSDATQSGNITTDAPVIDLQGISKSYGGVQALDGVSFNVRPGEMLGLIGPNGSGKTTLLNVLSGLTLPTSGSFVFLGTSSELVAGHPHRVARLGMSRTFQGIRLIADLDLRANVMLGAYSQRSVSLPKQILGSGGAITENAALEADAKRLLAEVGVDQPGGSNVTGLPYGTLRRVEIARALISRPRLLLLDEPAAGMTDKETAEVFDFMRVLCGRGTSIVVVEHDVAAIARYCDRIAVLNFGRLLKIGEPADVIGSPEVVEAYIGTRTRI